MNLLSIVTKNNQGHISIGVNMSEERKIKLVETELEAAFILRCLTHQYPTLIDESCILAEHDRRLGDDHSTGTKPGR